ncbi:MAG: 30S ribosomal protein S5 [Candidatus Magasanikbacteria bacterium GW2011_GWA2_45_39]|uniref:Small ribosomal subunit protein uS5 n=2 Tax=Candidatus Magasanikiibacteriota TaxID=1752731 RepID=A0A0G1MWL1_9BACT|nr:MAG: 30S ribosomal protein S5 [Candidatus Magasanikbacteria bacterium GW2011_GWA2_45_39]KKU12604.1 MAG: 30S ribosomal protein S5 [Candidatus Magasanikbacteria bacterium GW2011_GWC2_45_8]HBW73667.1 30S ribosomal protein S5 [Candidatus Magasanikbacteria bacterium]
MEQQSKQFGGNDRRKGQGGQGASRGGRGGGRGDRREREEREFAQEIIDLARVTRVTKGGKRMRFRACVVIGDKKGRVGFGVAKGADVTFSVNKAVNQAKKHMITVPIINETIPHRVDAKFASAVLLLKPAPKGSGIIAGGATRVVLQMAGVPNIVSKMLGSNNKINNVKATFKALEMLRVRREKSMVAIAPEASPVESKTDSAI